MTDEVLVLSLQEAFAAAQAEAGQTSPAVATGDLLSLDAATPDPDEQAPAASDEDEQNPPGTVDQLLGELGYEPPATSDPAFWGTEVEVDTDIGPKRVSLKDMRDGYMMRADYTRKTQDLARERGLVSEAVEFHQAFRDDPHGFAAFLAEKAGLIAAGTAPAKSGIKLYTEDEVSRLVDEGITVRLEEHPTVKAAREAAGVNAVHQVFTALEQRYGPISQENRIKVLQKANARNNPDIELVFESMLLEASQLAATRKAAKGAASAKPGGTPNAEQAIQAPKIETLADAFALAQKELARTVA